METGFSKTATDLLSENRNSDQDRKYSIIVKLAFLAVVLLSFLCFFPDLKNELLMWDDAGYIIDNTNIRNLSFGTIRWAFTTFYCNYWAPFTWISYAFDYAVWGLDPTGYHLTNNILHALNSGLFFLSVFELLKIYLSERKQSGSDAVFLNNRNIIACAVVAAIFFGIHPLRVESVAWAAERKDVLSFFFGISAVLFYLKYIGQPESGLPGYAFTDSRYYRLMVLFFIFSLLSKAMLVTLPFVLLVLDWFPLRRFHDLSMRQLLTEKAPLLFLSVGISVITVISQGPSHISLEQSDILSRALNALHSVMAYLRLTVWHTDLSPFYLHPGNITEIGIEYGLPVLFFIVVTGVCIYFVRTRPVFMTAWLVYLITLLPVSGLAAVGPTAMGARFTYIPGLSVSLLAALGITYLCSGFRGSAVRISAAIGTLVILLFNVTSAVKQISFWKDDVALWSRVIELQKQPAGRPYFQRSYAYAVRGRYEEALTDINKAASIAESKRYNRMHDIYSVRAGILKDMNDYEGAIADLTLAISTASSDEKSRYYMERGALYRLQGRYELADQDFRTAYAGDSDL